jgi:hypothetical protein
MDIVPKIEPLDVWQLSEEPQEDADDDEEEEEEEGIFLYYAATSHWYVSTKSSMEMGAAHGWLRSPRTAKATPDGVTGKWEVEHHMITMLLSNYIVTPILLGHFLIQLHSNYIVTWCLCRWEVYDMENETWSGAKDLCARLPASKRAKTA